MLALLLWEKEMAVVPGAIETSFILSHSGNTAST
jgi:hypothetical protein